MEQLPAVQASEAVGVGTGDGDGVQHKCTVAQMSRVSQGVRTLMRTQFRIRYRHTRESPTRVVTCSPLTPTLSPPREREKRPRSLYSPGHLQSGYAWGSHGVATSPDSPLREEEGLATLKDSSTSDIVHEDRGVHTVRVQTIYGEGVPYPSLIADSAAARKSLPGGVRFSTEFEYNA